MDIPYCKEKVEEIRKNFENTLNDILELTRNENLKAEVEWGDRCYDNHKKVILRWKDTDVIFKEVNTDYNSFFATFRYLLNEVI